MNTKASAALKSMSWIAVMLVVVLAASCRYEDGPILSLRSKESRLVGKKKIVLYQVNGADSTAYFEDAYRNTTYDSTGFEWLSELEYSQIFCTAGCFTGYWELQEDKKTIFIRLPSLTTGGFSFPSGIWEILKLSESALWVRGSFVGKEYHIHLEELRG